MVKLSAPKQTVDPKIKLAREREQARLRIQAEKLNRANLEDTRKRRAGLFGRNSLLSNGAKGFVLGGNRKLN